MSFCFDIYLIVGHSVAVELLATNTKPRKIQKGWVAFGFLSSIFNQYSYSGTTDKKLFMVVC